MATQPMALAYDAALCPLNVLDRYLLVTERLLRRRLSGIPFNLHVRFHGRIDTAQLQTAADCLAVRWPLLTARLVRVPYPAWRPTGSRRWDVRRQAVASDSEVDLLAALNQLKSEPLDLETGDPARLIVLHRPGGDDVLTLQFTHVLMDGYGAFSLLQQLLEPSRIPPAADGPPTDLVGQMLAKTPPRDRWKAAARVMRLWREVRAVSLPRPTPPPDRVDPGRTTLRWMDETAFVGLRERLERIGPLANPTLALLASGCRTLRRYVPGPLGPKSAYKVALPYSLRRSAHRHLLFQNLATRVELVARPADLEDRDQLIRLFASQMRAQIAGNSTVGALQLIDVLCKIDRLAPWLTERMLRSRPMSLHATSWPEMVESGRAFLGASVDYAWASAPFIPFLGVSLNLVKAGRRFLAIFMHSPHTLSDEQASRFLDEWLEDLCRP